MNFTTYYADFHIHIGETIYGKPVKISASNQLTFQTIIEFVKESKGLDLIGIIDAHVPAVLEEVESLIQQGAVWELKDGGVSNGSVTVLLGSEKSEAADSGILSAPWLQLYRNQESLDGRPYRMAQVTETGRTLCRDPV